MSVAPRSHSNGGKTGPVQAGRCTCGLSDNAGVGAGDRDICSKGGIPTNVQPAAGSAAAVWALISSREIGVEVLCRKKKSARHEGGCIM